MSTGAKNDIEKATQIAQKMVREWGMSKKIGTIAVATEKEHVFLGRDIAQHRDYSEKTAELIDQEISRIINIAYNRAKKILTQKRPLLNKLAEQLLKKEIISGHEIDIMLNLKPKKKAARVK